MTDTNRQYLLKVFTGVHAGAEVPLSDGECHIGATDECDIFLEDCVAGNLGLRIKLDNGRATVLEAMGLCYLDGEPISANGIFIDAHQVITLGTTHLAFGPDKGEWPDFFPPEIKPPEIRQAIEKDDDQATEIAENTGQNISGSPAQAQGSEAPDETDGKDDSDSAPSPDETDSKDDSDSAPSPNETDGKGAAAQIEKRPTDAVRKKIRIGAAVLAAIGVIGMLLYIFSDTSLPPDVLRAKARKEIKELLDSYQVFAENIGVDAEDRLAISGFISLQSSRKELLRKLEKITFPKTVRLVAVDETLRSFEEVLQNYRLRLKVTHEGDGVFALNGFVRDSDLLRAVLARLREDLPMIKQIDVRTHTHEEVIPAIFEELENQGGVRGRIELQAHTDHIRVEGSFLPSDRVVWANVRTGIQKRFGKEISFKEAFIVKPEPNPEALPATAVAPAAQPSPLNGLASLKGQIAGVILSPRRYLLTSDGRKCFEGGLLAAGYMVNSIGSDKIVLIKDGNNISIPLMP